MTDRTCPECQTALAADANPQRVYCSTACRQRGGDRLRKRVKYRTDPEYVARQLADAARRRTDPEYVAQLRQAQRDRYRTDPEFRQRKLEQSRARHRKTRQENTP
jgi:hypothetical protein